MATKSGWQKKLSRNTGTGGSPTWNEIPNVMDVDVDDNFDEQVVSDRGDAGVKTYDLGERNWSCKFKMLEDFANEDYAALQTAFLGRAPIEVCVHDGAMATAGTKFTRAVCVVTSRPITEPLGGKVGAEFTLKPAKNGGAAPVTDGTVAA